MGVKAGKTGPLDGPKWPTPPHIEPDEGKWPKPDIDPYGGGYIPGGDK